MVYDIWKGNTYLITVSTIGSAKNLIEKDKSLFYMVKDDWEHYEPETEEEYQEMLEYKQRNF